MLMHIILSLLLILQSILMLLPAHSQEQNSVNSGQGNTPRFYFNPLLQMIYSQYAQEEAIGRAAGGFTDDTFGYGNEPSGRPTGGLSDPELDGSNNPSLDKTGRPSGGLSDPELEGSEN